MKHSDLYYQKSVVCNPSSTTLNPTPYFSLSFPVLSRILFLTPEKVVRFLFFFARTTSVFPFLLALHSQHILGCFPFLRTCPIFSCYFPISFPPFLTKLLRKGLLLFLPHLLFSFSISFCLGLDSLRSRFCNIHSSASRLLGR